jgi:glycosyltransferase involved in cell wall biosynthesis
MKRNNYISQPYYSWNGHYRQYYNNLLLGGNIKGVAVGNKEANSTDVGLNLWFKIDQGNFFWFSTFRIVNSILVHILLVRKLINCKKGGNISLIEFEPVSFLIFSPLYYLLKVKKFIVTIHSVEATYSSNRFKNLVIIFQRKIYFFAIALLIKIFNVEFVVHSKYHYEAFKLRYPISKVRIIEYPSPVVSDMKRIKPKKNNKIKVLFFGIVRQDKGLFEFLEELRITGNEFFEVRVVGKVQDKRVLDISIDGVEFVNSYVSDEQMKREFIAADFLLLPYPSTYAGGAGPLKDAFSFGLPVICKNTPFFNSYGIENNYGIVYDDVSEIERKLPVAIELYDQSITNSIIFARKNTWEAMRKSYEEIFLEE